jgi:hypothetical protein
MRVNRMCCMKLFLTWLLGVPILVTSMVMAQSLLMHNHGMKAQASPGSGICRQDDAHSVAPLVPKQGYRISCNPLTVQ